MSNFDSIYRDVFELAWKDPAGVFEHMSKLTEETGEFAQAINKMGGRKGKPGDYNEENLRQNLIEEAADCIQVIFSILAKKGITLDELEERFNEKNRKYSSFIHNKVNV